MARPEEPEYGKVEVCSHDSEQVHDTAIALCKAYHARRREGITPVGQITDAEMALDSRYSDWITANATALEDTDAKG